ncbi:hypothetical protein [Roseomonas xinghualingensis]|uniref:hypothetical protein n=1 Tax=Roseomonas xinghualingensis TaxID=2986475 RepID=UPI0021F0EE84|nr:hypothetical protein [Roseomonas sp. SXEYE001]MCV4207647.1 hypothetical protein [Roseomonas sp. SXEYE001]
MDRLLFFMWRLWRNPPSRRKLVVMLVALALAIGLVLVERYVGWPDWMRAERVPRPRLPSL